MYYEIRACTANRFFAVQTLRVFATEYEFVPQNRVAAREYEFVLPSTKSYYRVRACSTEYEFALVLLVVRATPPNNFKIAITSMPQNSSVGAQDRVVVKVSMGITATSFIAQGRPVVM